MLSLSELEKGDFVLFKNTPCQVLEKKHQHLGRGKAVYKVKFLNLLTQEKFIFSFRGEEEFEEIDIEEENFIFLYSHRGKFCFVKKDNPKERVFFEEKNVGTLKNFLRPKIEVKLLFFKQKPISIKLPLKLSFKVVETSPPIKGSGADVKTKKAKIETGYELKVPLFIKEGDEILINTESREYVKRL